jgi:hypothetical protein
MMHENLDLSDINQVLHVVRNPYGWNEHVVRDARLKLADEFERLRAEVDALRADAERYRAMRREKGGTMSDIDKAIRLINDWNHDKEPATHGHAVWVGLKLIHEVEALRAENDRMRETLQGILDSDWRKWEELASPEEFVRWAKARAKHALTPHGD